MDHITVNRSAYHPETPTTKPPLNASSPAKESISPSDEVLPDDIPQDEMTDVLADAIFRMHLDHNQEQPTKANETLMLLSWRDHMDKNGVPWHAVPALYSEAVKTKAQTGGRGFMPTIGEILSEWEKVLEAGYWESRNAPETDLSLPALGPGEAPLPGGINTDKAPAFVKAFVVLSKRGAAVTCHCAGDKWCHNGYKSASLIEDGWGSYWVCAQGKCDFKIKADDLLSLAPIPMPGSDAKPTAPEPPARDYSEEDLLAALKDRCEFQVEKIKRESALAFARHLQKLAAVELWTHALARAQWAKWQEQKTNQVVAT